MASFERSLRTERSHEPGPRHRDARPRAPDRRRRLEPELLRPETHFHSLIEQQSITRGRPLIHDVELERRQSAGHCHHESLS